MSRRLAPMVLGCCVAAVFCVASTTISSRAGPKSLGSLHAIKLDGKVQAPCNDFDVLNLADHGDVKATIRAFGLDSARIEFRGCPDQKFRVDQLAPNEAHHYLITYPADYPDDMLPALTHELAHVFQMELVGGFAKLRDKQTPSIRVELGADYLAGVVYKRSARDRSTFLHSLSLIGVYFEDDPVAHGTPAQRAAAFRMGFFSDSDQQSLRALHEEFVDDVYASVIRT